jgi:hypothetical protein
MYFASEHYLCAAIAPRNTAKLFVTTAASRKAFVTLACVALALPITIRIYLFSHASTSWAVSIKPYLRPL